MPRKPRIQRLQEAQVLLSAYTQAGLADDYQARFIRDMVTRLTGSRNLTSKQKSWLDSLIEEGVPAPKGNAELIQRIERALQTPGTAHLQNPLTDFLGRERKGWDVSDKQRAFRERLLKEAEDIAVNGPWIPSSEQVEKLKMCLDLAKSRDGVYWQTHPGDGRALMKVQDYFAGEEEHIDQWSVERLIKCFRVAFRELDKPYANQGDMIWTRVRDDNPGNTKYHHSTVVVPALIAGPPEINERGSIVYPVLADGTMTYLSKDNLMKRKPRS